MVVERRHEQVTAHLRALVASGQVGLGEQLPTISELQDELGVGGVQTVRDGYAPLIDEGLVVSRVGAGGGFFLVRAPKAGPDTALVERLTLMMDALGRAEAGVREAWAHASAIEALVVSAGNVGGSGYGQGDLTMTDGEELDGKATRIRNSWPREPGELMGGAGGGTS